MKIVWRNGIAHAQLLISLENTPDYANALLELLELAHNQDSWEVNNSTVLWTLMLIKELQLSAKQTAHIALKRDPAQLPQE